MLIQQERLHICENWSELKSEAQKVGERHIGQLLSRPYCLHELLLN